MMPANLLQQAVSFLQMALVQVGRGKLQGNITVRFRVGGHGLFQMAGSGREFALVQCDVAVPEFEAVAPVGTGHIFRQSMAEA